MFEMKDEYKVGIPEIDDQHTKLFAIGERAYNLLKDEYALDKYDRIMEIIDELRNYTAIHFKYEEEYMKSINYKGLFTQKVEHDAFIKKINEVDLNKVDENQDEAIMEILTFIANWLTGHILGKDKLIGQK